MAQNQHVAALDAEMKGAFPEGETFGASQTGRDFGALASFGADRAIGSFQMTVVQYILSLGKQAIDTPEERQKLKDAVLKAFDTYLAPYLGPVMLRIARKSLDNFVTNALEQLALAA